VIAGHGAKAFLIPLFITLAVSFGVAKAILGFRRRVRDFSLGSWGRFLQGTNVRIFGLTVSIVVVGIALLLMWLLSLWAVSAIFKLDNILVIGASVTVGILGGFVI